MIIFLYLLAMLKQTENTETGNITYIATYISH